MRILIIEDQTLLGHTLAATLRSVPECEVVGLSERASEAPALCASLHPDLVIMDVYTKDGNGIEYAAHLKKDYPHIKVLILTGVEDNGLIKAAENAGVDVFLQKSTDIDNLVEIMHCALKNYRVFPGCAAGTAPATVFSNLEIRILELLAQGRSAREIAADLFLSYGTIRVYISRMYSTTGCKSRANLIAYALRQGVILSQQS